MGKNQISVVVLRIRLKIWWMILMGVRDNHTRYEPETQRWRPRMVVASGRPRFRKMQSRTIVSPRTHSKHPNKGKGWVHSMCGLTFPCQRALCGPLIPPYVPETAQKGPQKPQILCRLAGDGHKPRTGHIFGYHGSKWRHLVHPQPPTFCGLHPSELPQRTPRPPYRGPVGCGKLQAQAQTGGCPNGSTGSNRGKKLTFLKNDPRPCVMLKQVFLEYFELVVAHFGPPEIPKCVKTRAK